MDEQNDDFFGEFVTPTEIPEHIKHHIQQEFTEVVIPSFIIRQQDQQIPITARSRGNPLKRKISLSSDVPGNPKSTAGKSIDGTHDNSEFCSFESSLIRKKRNNSPQIKPLVPEVMFPCPLCRGISGKENCFVCRGSGSAQGSDNFSKFFEYIMEFKLGKKSSYENRKTREVHKPSVNQFCGDFFNSQQIKNQNKGKKSTRLSLNRASENATICFSDYKQKLMRHSNVHKNFQCDECSMDPIIGSRFHCTDPECDNDFDLCEGCYVRFGHRHEVEEIKETKLGEKLQVLGKFLGVTNKMSSSIQEKRIFYSSIH